MKSRFLCIFLSFLIFSACSGRNAVRIQRDDLESIKIIQIDNESTFFMKQTNDKKQIENIIGQFNNLTILNESSEHETSQYKFIFMYKDGKQKSLLYKNGILKVNDHNLNIDDSAMNKIYKQLDCDEICVDEYGNAIFKDADESQKDTSSSDTEHFETIKSQTSSIYNREEDIDSSEPPLNPSSSVPVNSNENVIVSSPESTPSSSAPLGSKDNPLADEPQNESSSLPPLGTKENPIAYEPIADDYDIETDESESITEEIVDHVCSN